MSAIGFRIVLLNASWAASGIMTLPSNPRKAPIKSAMPILSTGFTDEQGTDMRTTFTFFE